MICRACSFLTLLALAAPAGAEPKLAGNVLVWVDAKLYLDADEGAPSVKIGQLDHARDESPGHVVPMHVVGEQGAFIEVEPTADIDCAWWRVLKPAQLASLHVYVKRADLAPVVTKAFAAAFKDGSRISVQPGAPAIAGKLAFHGGVVPAKIPEANLGLAYAPHAVADVVRPAKHTFLIDEGTEVSLGDQTFTLGPWVAASAEKRGDRMLVPVAVRCMSAVVSAPKDRVHADVSIGRGVGVGGVAGGMLGRGTGDRYVLAKGAKLTSASGSHVVATLASDFEIAQPTGDRACGDFVIDHLEPIDEAPHANDASRPDRTLHLCAPASSVRVDQH